MSKLTAEQMATIAHTNFIENQIDNKHIVPSLKTQIYAMGEFRDRYGDERLVMANYDDDMRSTFTVTSNNPLTYGFEEVEAIPDGSSSSGNELPAITSAIKNKYYTITEDNTKKYYVGKEYGAADVNNLRSTDSVTVAITLNSDMLKINPKPNIVIDGREYTSAIASGDPIVFYMNRDHRISILWTADTTETFLVIANR